TTPVFPSRILTSAVTPGPVPTATSGVPSPLKSATAVRSPPVVPGNGLKVLATDPSGLYSVTVAGPPTSDPTANCGTPTRVAGGAGGTVGVPAATSNVFVVAGGRPPAEACNW